MNIIALNTQAQATPIAAPTTGRKIKGDKVAKQAKARSAKPQAPKASKVVSELNALRTELKALTGAPVSPLMTIEQIKAKIEEVKNPAPEPVEVEPKAKVIPSKPQGIGAYCVSRLKEGAKPKDVLAEVMVKFDNPKTTMACVYWYASKIKAGVL